MTTDSNLAVTDKDLLKLANDLDDMQGYLDQQVKRMDTIVDAIEVGWRGPAAKAYRRQHLEAAKDAVRIRELMKLIEAAVRMSRNGFTEQELETLEAFRRIQMSVDVASEAAELSTPNAGTEPATPRRSRIHEL